MIYPVSPGAYYQRRKKKKKKKWPWLMLIIILAIASISMWIFWRHQSLHQSAEMNYPRVDYIFLLPESDKVIVIRNDTVRRISYVINLSTMTYDPVLKIRLDHQSPQELAPAIRSLLGPADHAFYVSLKNTDVGRLGGILSITDFQLSDDDALTRLFQAIPLGFLEFLTFSSIQRVMPFLTDGNMNARAVFRLVDQLRHFAIQTVPVQYQTTHPVTIHLQDRADTLQVRRLYLETERLQQIKEFINP